MSETYVIKATTEYGAEVKIVCLPYSNTNGGREKLYHYEIYSLDDEQLLPPEIEAGDCVEYKESLHIVGTVEKNELGTFVHLPSTGKGYLNVEKVALRAKKR